MKSFKTFYSEAKKPKPGHNATVLAKNISKVMSAVKKEEADLDEATYVHTDFTDRTSPLPNKKAYAIDKANDEKKPVSLKKAPWELKKEEADLDENIKGWKHAASDISKMRAAQGKTVKLVSLKKDGTESKMHDATKMFRSEDEAQEHHDRITKLNPKSKIAHNMYVDGKHVKTLGT